MSKLPALALLLLTCSLATGRDKTENWLQIRSQNFTVLTNSNEKTARHIAGEFERMRAVFHLMFPQLSIDNGSPILVLAIKDDKDFRALEPQVYLAKGQLKLGGLFLRAPEKNYVLLRIEAEGDHPYAIIYHEYTHFLLSKAAEWMPLWMNEGLAQFYENTDIHEKDVALGQPSSQNLELLREKRLLPLATLFTVDTSSPYYHEENKGSIFYAESWALTHYIYVKDFKENKHTLTDYAALLTQKIDPVTAATRVFGDLNKLQSSLEAYIHQGSFTYLKVAASTEVNDSSFNLQPLSPTQADALRADFLAYNDRVADARPLLDHVLQEDPKNVSAHETMGFMEIRAGHIDEARKWYQQAVQLDSQSYVSNYNFAALTMNHMSEPGDDSLVESSLRAAIKLNPKFAPAYERLAAFEGMRHRNLDEAHMMALKAVELDPGNVAYRLTTASVLMQMERSTDAVAVLHLALKLAKSPHETEEVENFLNQAEAFNDARDRHEQQVKAIAEANAEANANFEREQLANVEVAEEVAPTGPHHFLVGTVHEVSCHGSGIEMKIAAKGKMSALHNGNLYKIGFTALGFTPTGELNPCKDLEGKPAKVEYVDSPAKPSGYVISIEVHQ